MKLVRVELCGFKSFVDRTVIDFDDQVTAIVGPNGCGKSNILDGIRWAMGEQSARSLRGKVMEEVIFSGSETRSATSSAEVTITFDTRGSSCHPVYRDYSEIAITRRLSRDGSSEYVINGTPCRLRDVTELLLTAGVSPRSSMVEQGRMGVIVTARPEERRLLIEEAAGIAKYRIHRRATQRKMDQTRQNLLRVTDVVAEMKRTLNSLKRQVSKAKRFTRFRDELTELELRVASHRYLELSTISRRREADLGESESEQTRVQAVVEGHEATIAEQRNAQRRSEEQLEHFQGESYNASNMVQQTKGRIDQLLRHLNDEIRKEFEAESRSGSLAGKLKASRAEMFDIESGHGKTSEKVSSLEEQLGLRQRKLEAVRESRVEVESRLESCRQRVTKASSTIAAGERSFESLERRHREGTERVQEIQVALSEASRNVVELESQHAALTQSLGQLKQRALDLGTSREECEAEKARRTTALNEATLDLDKVGMELTQNRSRLQSLEEIAGRYENFGQGVRELMRRDEVRDRTKAVVAEILDVPSTLEPAIAAALGERLQDLVVEDIRDAASVAEVITKTKVGRAAAIPVVPRRVGLPAKHTSGEGVLGLLADMIGCERRYEPLIRQLLWGIVVVEDLSRAVKLWSEWGGELTYVTKNGEVVSPNGRISAGKETLGLALLQTKREIRRLQEKVESLEQDHEQRAERVASLRAKVADLRASIEDLRRDAHRRDLEVVQYQKDHSRAEDEIRRQRTDRERISRESSKISEMLEECIAERDRVTAEIEAAALDRKGAEDELAESNRWLAQCRGEEDEALANVTELRVQAASAKERQDSQASALARLSRECGDICSQLDDFQTNRGRAAEEQGRTGGELFAAREHLLKLIEDDATARTVLQSSRDDLEKIRIVLAEAEAAAHDSRKRRDAIRAEAERQRLALHETRMELKSLLERVSEARNLDLEMVVVDYHLAEPATEEDLDHIEELRRKIERIGPVSLTAVEEYDELDVRYEESTRQQEDLEKSLAHLQRAIQKLNKEGRRRFSETFQEVNSHFLTFFPRLFEGGRAKLMLTDENDMLETGVEIVAQPPGKKLGRMELMSGGEKALTAVSLIFALFKASPSPFTILDEVDAPFDDANVRRYLGVLREMSSNSQFVLVTHSKLSMSEADVLYGVTMEEPGVSKIVSVNLSEKSGDDEQAAAA